MKAFGVLHIASFTGNIGDNANHLGFRRWFETLVENKIQWNELEIREFYWKNKFWDKEFVKYANNFDLIIIGGGNYFELWVEKSPTGTSIEIEPVLFKQIERPVYFNALGVDPGQGASEFSIEKFKTFIEIIAEKNGLITVRNDGALANLEEYVGSDYLKYFHEAPDGGFFINGFIKDDIKKSDQKIKIGCNVASDMPEVRFKEFIDGVDGFSKEFAQAIVKISKQLNNCEFVFFPHIFKDLEIINNIITYLPDEFRRKYLTVFEYSTGNHAAIKTFSSYKECNLILATRFHANVCSLSLGINTLGLMNYIQIENLYKGLEQEEKLVDVRTSGFSEVLEYKVLSILKDKTNNVSKEPLDMVIEMRAKMEVILTNWLKESM